MTESKASYNTTPPAGQPPAKFITAGSQAGLEYLSAKIDPEAQQYLCSRQFIAAKCSHCGQYAYFRQSPKIAYKSAIYFDWRVIRLPARPPACNVKRIVRLWQCAKCTGLKGEVYHDN